MRQFHHIARKECAGYFISPIAYIVIAVYLVVAGWFFFSTFFIYEQASMRNFFSLLPVIFSFVIPAVTMRLFAEELNTGSYELLATMPVTRSDIIAGKFAAGLVMTAAMLAPTLVYPVSISLLGDLDWGPVIGGYIGALLLGGAFSAIGLFASSLTRNQIIAFILAAAVCVGLTLVDRMLIFVPGRTVNIVEYLAAGHHFENIARGVIDTRDILYFLSVMFAGLYATGVSLEYKQ